MSDERVYASATRLTDGRVLVAGGGNGIDESLTVAEIFDPVTRTWSATDPMTTGRSHHSATLLADGKVLVAGGYDAWASAELYDPATGMWSSTGSLNVPQRSTHTASLLPDGKVLVAGGTDGGDRQTAEIYDPSSGTWAFTGSMIEGRVGHSAVGLGDGTVLVAGGSGPFGSGSRTSAETYDPGTGAWSPAGNMASARAGPDIATPMVLLPSGKVLIAGNTTLESGKVELWDPVTRTWSAGPDMASKRYGAAGVLLPSGKVLISGGDGNSGSATAEIYDPVSNTWAPTGAMHGARRAHTATLLANGKVLVIGGFGAAPGIGALAELAFAPETTFTSGPDGPSSSSSATFTFASTEPGSTFHCALDGAALEPCTSPASYAGLADGSHTLTVRATDATGLVEPAPPSRTWSVDATAPSVGLIAPANGGVTASATPSFTGPAGSAGGDDVSIVVKVYSGTAASGEPVQTLTTSRSGGTWSAQPTAPLADGTFTAQAEQGDSVGNVGRSSAATFTVDTQAPEAFGLVAPENGAITADATPTLTWQPVADNAGGTGVARLEVLVDGAVLAGDLAPGATEFTPSAALADGSHTWTVRAFDVAGNRRESGLPSFTIDTVSPEPPAGPVGVSINGGATYTNDPNVTVSAVWPRFARTALLSNDGGFQTAVQVPVAAQIPWRLNSSGPERLPKTLYVRFQPVGVGTYQDDIILDETAPNITLATVAVPSTSAASVAAVRRYVVRLRARDRTSGVSRAQLAVRKRKPMRVRKYRTKMAVRAAKRPRYVRVRDRAGNWSRWKSLERR